MPRVGNVKQRGCKYRPLYSPLFPLNYNKTIYIYIQNIQFLLQIFHFLLNLLNIHSHNFTLHSFKLILKSYFNSHTFTTKIFQIHHLFNFQYFTFHIFINKSINTSNILSIFYTHIKNHSTNQI